jgi:hypothetical protein
VEIFKINHGGAIALAPDVECPRFSDLPEARWGVWRYQNMLNIENSIKRRE